jgi:hypothetical protein
VIKGVSLGVGTGKARGQERGWSASSTATRAEAFSPAEGPAATATEGDRGRRPPRAPISCGMGRAGVPSCPWRSGPAGESDAGSPLWLRERCKESLHIYSIITCHVSR